MVTNLQCPFLLVATPASVDPVFQHSVILMAEYSKAGALGFIINRPEAIPLKQVVSISDIDVPDDIPTWFGGPVSLDTGIVLADQSAAKLGDEYETDLGHDIRLSPNQCAIEKLISYAGTYRDFLKAGSSTPPPEGFRNGLLYPYRFIVGYAGWGPNQLEQELKRGAWLAVPVSNTLIFETAWDHIWHEAIGTFGASPSHLATNAQSLLC